MKLASQNRRSAFVLILLAVLLLFTVVGFAAGESSVAEAAQNGVATLRGYINRGIEKLKDANYIGNACRSAFDGLGNIKDYWWIIIGVIALIECFFGYRLFRLELALIGFIGGFVGGLFLYPVLENLIPAMANVPAVQVEEEMLVLAFLPEATMDKLLRALRESGLTVRLKAVLTPTNMHWNCGQLYRELRGEAAAFAARKP